MTGDGDYSYDKAGPLYGHFTGDCQSKDGKTNWQACDFGGVTGNFALRFTGTGLPTSGLKWTYPGNANPGSANPKSPAWKYVITSSNHARMIWEQPDDVTVLWFCARPYDRNGVTNIRLEIRKGSTGATPSIDITKSASAIADYLPNKSDGTRKVPWCYWNMGTEFTFEKGATYVADFYPKEGSFGMTRFEQTATSHESREHGIGNAYQGGTKIGSNFAWSMCWLEKSFNGGATPWLPWMVRPA
jgi:hypothetical protein